jgi:hypothetical protein
MPFARGSRSLAPQVQRSSLGTWRITWGTWEPQPDQVVFEQVRQVAGLHMVVSFAGEERGEKRGNEMYGQCLRDASRASRTRSCGCP